MSSQFPDLETTAPRIDAAELKARLDRGESVTILDTRRPPDYEAWHVDAPGVTPVNVPFTEFLDPQGRPVEELPDGVPEGDLVVNCAVGVSSQYVGDLLVRDGGDRSVEVIDGGMEGWARLYESIGVELEGSADLVQFHRPSSGCLSYMVVDGDEAAVVDPLRAFADRYEAEARERGASLEYAIDTHVHADHVSGVRTLGSRTGARVVVPGGAEDRGLAFDDYRTVGDGEDLQVGETTLSTVALPGHTTEMVGFRVGDALLCGDTLFTDGVGRPDLESGDEGAPDLARELYDTLQSVAELPDETLVAPGHTASITPREGDSYTAGLGALRGELWAFSVDREAFVDRLLENRPPRPNNYERIIEVNLGRASAGDDEAFELELGPNNCAAG